MNHYQVGIAIAVWAGYGASLASQQFPSDSEQAGTLLEIVGEHREYLGETSKQMCSKGWDSAYQGIVQKYPRVEDMSDSARDLAEHRFDEYCGYIQ